MIIIFQRYNLETSQLPTIKVHDKVSECITIGRLNETELDLIPVPKEVIVNSFCGASILRGAHVFAPGVLGMLPSKLVIDYLFLLFGPSSLKEECFQAYRLEIKFQFMRIYQQSASKDTRSIMKQKANYSLVMV